MFMAVNNIYIRKKKRYEILIWSSCLQAPGNSFRIYLFTYVYIVEVVDALITNTEILIFMDAG